MGQLILNVSRKLFLTILALNLFVIVNSQSIEIQYNSSYPRQLGGTFPLGIKLTDKKGQIKQTKGFLGGKQNWNRYNINVLGGTFRKGMVTITDDPEFIKNHNIVIIANLVSNPKVSDKIDIMLNYKGLTVADFTPPRKQTQ